MQAADYYGAEHWETEHLYLLRNEVRDPSIPQNCLSNNTTERHGIVDWLKIIERRPFTEDRRSCDNTAHTECQFIHAGERCVYAV